MSTAFFQALRMSAADAMSSTPSIL